MQATKNRSILGLAGAMIAGIIAVGSAYVGWLLVDETQLGWILSRGFAFIALALGILSLVAILGGLETSSNENKNKI